MTEVIRPPSHRLRYPNIAFFCGGAVPWMITLMQKNVVFFKTVDVAVADRAHDGNREFRIGGSVVPGTITHTADGANFRLTAGGQTVWVDHTGTEPTLFKNCAPVVADGHWSGTTFISDQILIKHGAPYSPTPSSSTKCPPDPFGHGT